MKANKRSRTGPELILSRILRKKVLANNLPGRPDFVYPKVRLAIFVHGCFWHRCPVDQPRLPKTNRGFWRRKFRRNIERDRLNREELESMGWKVMEIWEHEIKADSRGCAKRVLAEVKALEARPLD